MAEPIAQLTDATVNRREVVGRDDRGLPIERKVCPRGHVKMLDLDGNEVDVPVQNSRVATRKSLEKYGNRHLRDMVKAGYIPKGECPLTMAYAHDVGGPLVAPKKGDSLCEIDQADTTRKDWKGCEHYLRVRELRQSLAASDAEKRSRDKPTNAMLQLVNEMRQERGERDAGDLKKRRGAMAKGKSTE